MDWIHCNICGEKPSKTNGPKLHIGDCGNPNFGATHSTQGSCPKCRASTVLRAIDSTLDHDRKNYFMNPKRVLEDASKKVVKIIDFQDKHRKSHINFANHKMEHILKMGRNHEETAKRSSEAVKASANEIGKYKKKAESSTATAENYREQFNELNKKYAELRTSISSTQRTVTRSSSPIKTIGSGVTKHSSKKNDFSSKSNQTQFTTSMLLGYSTAASQNQTNQQHGNPFRNTSNILSMGGNTNLNQLFDISAERTVLKAKGEPYLTSTPFGGHLYGKENQSKSFKDTPRPRNPFGNNHLY